MQSLTTRPSSSREQNHLINLEEVEKLKLKLKKEEETVGFMFKRTKELSA